MRTPTIYEALVAKLGRTPTDAEVKADVERILEEGLIERATKGKLPHQRRRRCTGSRLRCVVADERMA